MASAAGAVPGRVDRRERRALDRRRLSRGLDRVSRLGDVLVAAYGSRDLLVERRPAADSAVVPGGARSAGVVPAATRAQRGALAERGQATGTSGRALGHPLRRPVHRARLVRVHRRSRLPGPGRRHLGAARLPTRRLGPHLARVPRDRGVRAQHARVRRGVGRYRMGERAGRRGDGGSPHVAAWATR